MAHPVDIPNTWPLPRVMAHEPTAGCSLMCRQVAHQRSTRASCRRTDLGRGEAADRKSLRCVRHRGV